MIVEIINKSKHPNPSYKTHGSSGLDIRANIENSINLRSMERAVIPTGIYLDIPENTEAQIRPRSGLALKSGITVLNTPGTIDSDYRGEVAVILINLSKEVFIINDGDRIAQMVFSKVEKINWREKKILTKTERGSGGFGSTGTK
ncbi:MAG: dUTP diphosphatase [Flavobacteriales bacterium]|nr:dUTP diphosphatase [Flavobacteriales bacterium]|tara:strand:- start:28657 stop:29091 length:435 start_codon:yes stop_codon:yes gene_type:complete